MVSIVSLDLGGKNTGFFSFTSNDVSKIDAFQSGTIIYDESFVLSQVKRRGKRHGKRNNLRNKLVKRLFLLILQEHYKLTIDFLSDEVLGLFNKRGYTYASFELKDDEKDNLESDILKEFLNDNIEQYNIKSDDLVEEFLNQIASNEDTFREYKRVYEEFFTLITHKPKKQLELKDEIKSQFEKIEQKELFDGLKIVKKIIEEFDKQQNQGNLPRAKYFIELNQEIEQNQKIQEFFQAHNLKIEDMQNLIGNLSNYQLKELRRYFNDKSMVEGDIWDDKKLHKTTWRFIQSWHFKKDVKDKKQKEEARSQLLKNLKEKNIIEFLTTTEPKNTIPPYDDMNNRGAVKCQTLRLNEEYLDIHLPNWRNIAQKLASENQKENLGESTVKGYSEDSTLLHRILDTSASIDMYALRSDKIDGYIDILGKNDASALQKFAKSYYELIKDKIRTGIWTSTDAMLKKCNHNPPYKNNQIHNLVAGILGKKIEAQDFAKFETELWNVKFGARKLSSYCKNIEELRKSHGNLFKSYVEELFSEDKEKPTKEELKDKKLLDEKVLNEWVEKIGEFFGIEQKYQARFNNHFSFAQLHTIIDTKRSGFNSTCKWCSSENQYRTSTNIEVNHETGEVTTNANAQRLPADTQRPFSGKIERYIDKLGYEIAKIKAKELENIQDKKIDLKIILEQNAFEYEESIRSAKIKNANAKAKKNLEESTQKYKKSLKDKDARIKSFSGSICPYCGESLGDDGEIDHILPRSYTLKNFGTVFNSEGNLLFVHQKCNQAKKETIYKLQDIKSPITQEEIEKIINLISKNSYKTFTALTPEQQKAFKYALFLDSNNEAYQKVVNWLRTDQSSRVNGTQKYLAKKIQEKLKAMMPNKEFDFEFILANAEDVSNLRKTYAVQNPLLTKPDTQPPSSHTIDAIMAFLSVYPKVVKKDELPDSQKVLGWVEINNIKTKPLSKIQKDQKQNLGGTTIFKDSIYQERFAPIYEYENRFYIGFVGNGKNLDFSNCIELKQKDFQTIKEYLKNEINKPSGLKFYEIDKQKTLTLFHNISKGFSDEIKLAELLNKFSYNLLKTSVGEAPKILKDDKKLSTKVYDKTMILPIKQEWQNFDKAFKKHLQDKNIEYKENKGKYDVGEDILSEFCKSYFGIQNKPIRNKARKVFSLPTVEAPSGGFRIRRKNHKGENVYQLVGIDGASSKGYEHNQTSKTKTVLLDNLLQSKNLSLKDPNYMMDKKYVPMNQYRMIVLNDYQIIFSFDTVDRNKIILSMPWEKLNSMLFEQNISIYDLPEKLPVKDALTEKQKNGIIKKEFEKEFIFKEYNSNKTFSFKPRNTVYIKKVIDNIVTIEFVNENRGILSYFYTSKLLDD